MLPVPQSRYLVSVRVGMVDDLPFVDKLQKANRDGLGFFHRATLEGKVRLGHLLVAEVAERPVGYIIGSDRYYKRDDLGIVYQLCVESGHRRGLVAATLLRELFARAAWGCKLYCCWCANDLEGPSRFWESMGFAPIAFRGGSRARKRVHVFWQRRIRRGDDVTPYWYPSLTQGGAIAADRVALPVPPGTHWSEVARPVLPGDDERPKLPGRTVKPTAGATVAKQVEAARPAANTIGAGGLWFVPPPAEATPVMRNLTKKREKPPEPKASPLLVAAARELRDRWQERVTEEPWMIASVPRYEVARLLPESGGRAEGPRAIAVDERRLLPAA